MTFGIKFANSNDEVVISDTTYNTVFIGRAWHYHTFNTGGNYARQAHAAGGFTSPWMNEYGFKITAPNHYPIIPFFKCSGYAGIMSVSRDPGVTNGWIILCTAESLPEIFCFSKVMPQVVPNGYGIVIRDSAGQICYSSALPHLVPYLAKPADTPASNLFKYDYGSFELVVPNQATVMTPSERWASVPLLHFASGMTALGWEGTYDQYAFLCVAKWTPLGVQVRWGYAAAFASYARLWQDVAQGPIAAIGCDGIAF